MPFVITAQKRNNHKVTLFMVDRKVQQKSFWSDRLTADVLVFQDEEAANKVCARLKFNNPRVITLERAKFFEEKNANLREDKPKTAEKRTFCTLGEFWDEHKEWRPS